jgi:peptidyl-prolyl cis-trans isomerase B (cyclophilin B)
MPQKGMAIKKMKKRFILSLILLLIILPGCGKTSKPEVTQPIEQESKSSEAGANNSMKPDQYQLAPPEKGDIIAIITTTMGVIKVKFFPKEAPKAVENFTKLATSGYYNGLTFHRIINNFMIQGGDPLGNGTGGQSIWKKPFEDEFSDNLHNYRGALSMANSGPNTNGSQFFIVQKNTIEDNLQQWMRQNGFNQELIDSYINNGGTPWLDNHHTVFGQVFEGIDVVDQIAAVKTDANGKSAQDMKIVRIDITKQE